MEYDIIVVGAGNAGLSAAATATQYRMKTLVLERNPVPGGCATSFCRGRFEFEPSLHELADVGTQENPGGIRRLFADYRAQVDWAVEKNAFRVMAGGPEGYDITMSSGVEAFCDALEAACPGSRESAEKVFDLASRANGLLVRLMRGQLKREEDPDFLRAMTHPVAVCLDALGMPKRAQQILNTYWVYLGVPPEELNFLHYALMLDMYVRTPPAIPHGRSHELTMALVDRILACGGELRCGTEVTGLLWENGRVCGVETADGARIRAHQVLCSAFPEQAMDRLLPAEAVPSGLKKLTAARRTGVQFFCVYLGLNRSAEELGIRDYTLFLTADPDSRKVYAHLEDPTKSVIIANCQNVVIPDASPAGTCLLSFTAMLPSDYDPEITPRAYKKWKNAMADRMIAAYEGRTGLSVRPYIEEISVVTPATFARYLGTPGGTPYGYTTPCWDSLPMRLLAARDEQFLPGLTFIGAHAERGDGYSSTYINGHSAAGGAVIAARMAAREAKRHV